MQIGIIPFVLKTHIQFTFFPLWFLFYLSKVRKILSLGWEDPPEKEMAPHSRTLAWRIPWTEEPGRLQSMRSQRVSHFTLSDLKKTTGLGWSWNASEFIDPLWEKEVRPL